MTDRNVQHPRRYQQDPVPGTTNIFDFTPAPGEVYDEGTMINKATLLKDETAALYGLGTDAVPDDVLAILSKAALATDGSLFDVNGDPVGPQIETGSYTGTGTYGSSNPNSLTFGFEPKVVRILAYFNPVASVYSVVWTTGMYCPPLSTEFVKNLGMGNTSASFGRKSSDGKTVYWYDSEAVTQFNLAGYTYYYIALG